MEFNNMSTAEALNALGSGVIKEMSWAGESQRYRLEGGIVVSSSGTRRKSLELMLLEWERLSSSYGRNWTGYL